MGDFREVVQRKTFVSRGETKRTQPAWLFERFTILLSSAKMAPTLWMMKRWARTRCSPRKIRELKALETSRAASRVTSTQLLRGGAFRQGVGVVAEGGQQVKEEGLGFALLVAPELGGKQSEIA